MRSMRWLMALLCFSLEVRLKAAEQDPKGCIRQAGRPCVLFSSKPTAINLKKTKWLLSAGSILFRDRQSQWNFVAGTLRVESPVPLHLGTKYGRMVLSPGTHWLQWRGDRLWAYAVEGDLRMELIASSLTENLVPSGFMSWFGPIDFRGVNEQGLPRRISIETALQSLPGFKKTPDYNLVSRQESRMIASAGQFYGLIAETMSESVRQREDQQRRRLEAIQSEERRLRTLFRNKYFGPVEWPEEASEDAKEVN